MNTPYCAGLPELPTVSADAVKLFHRAITSVTAQVAAHLESRPDLDMFTGGNSPDLLRGMLRHQARFMLIIFTVDSPQQIASFLLWNHQTSQAQGFSSEFFALLLDAWRTVVRDRFTTHGEGGELPSFYDWLARCHETSSVSPGEGIYPAVSLTHNVKGVQLPFLWLLLQGNFSSCLQFSSSLIETLDDLRQFYLKVIWPVFYRIGELWSSGLISVAEEHLATNLVKRVMPVLLSRFTMNRVTRGKALVSTSPNEHHEIGARMVADFLELDGWDVIYLGANIPSWALLDMVQREKPFLIALSAATEINLGNIRYIIDMIRGDRRLRETKIMVGGYAFCHSWLHWQQIGADGHAPDAQGGALIAAEWWSARQGDKSQDESNHSGLRLKAEG